MLSIASDPIVGSRRKSLHAAEFEYTAKSVHVEISPNRRVQDNTSATEVACERSEEVLFPIDLTVYLPDVSNGHRVKRIDRKSS